MDIYEKRRLIVYIRFKATFLHSCYIKSYKKVVIMKSEFPEPLLYTVEEAAYLLSLSKSSVHRLIKEGKVKTLHPSPGSLRIGRTDLELFIKRAKREESCQQ